MCGIAGKFNFDPANPVDGSTLRAMTTVMTHRGPDAAGVFIGPGIGLGHRRLSIIDLSTGAQPLSNEDGSIWVIFNGEIYNFAEIRSELVQRGHRFRTSSDTEVIVHAYEEWGETLGRSVPRHVRVRDLGRRGDAGCCSCATDSASSRSTTRSRRPGVTSAPR